MNYHLRCQQIMLESLLGLKYVMLHMYLLTGWDLKQLLKETDWKKDGLIDRDIQCHKIYLLFSMCTSHVPKTEQLVTLQHLYYWNFQSQPFREHKELMQSWISFPCTFKNIERDITLTRFTKSLSFLHLDHCSTYICMQKKSHSSEINDILYKKFNSFSS